MYFVYILECADTSLYIGSTNDLDRRLKQHNSLKSGARYTKNRRPVVLKYIERKKTLRNALKREAALKKLTRLQKLMLISHATIPLLPDQPICMAKGNNARRKEAKKPKKAKK